MYDNSTIKPTMMKGWETELLNLIDFLEIFCVREIKYHWDIYWNIASYEK